MAGDGGGGSVSVVGYKARNHPQQVASHGARPEIDDRATPPEVFGPLNERFAFTIDAAAAPHNTKCPRYWTEADDGLAQPWAGERVWLNPPHSFPNLPAWVAKAWREWKDAGPGCRVVRLPAPLRRPQTQAALPAGDSWHGGDDDEEGPF